MTQPPPPPPNEPPGPPQGGFGAPQDPPSGGFGPPQEPPAGGFGAPQDPPSGGYGAPTPPQNPPYGYPQTPPAQPGYGYPTQGPPQGAPQGPPPGPPQGPPPGYGQQPGYPGQPQGYPGQQPGYGYPAQPQYGVPPQPPQGGKKFGTQMQIIVAAAVAVVLIVGAGIWYSSSGDDGPAKDQATGDSAGATAGASGGDKGGGGKEKVPSNTKSKVAFKLPRPKVVDIADFSGSWITDTAFVKPGNNSVVGYDLDKGTQLWSTPLAGQVCAASQHVSKDNKAAIVFEPAKMTPAEKYQPCTQVGVIDLTSGKLLWSKAVKGSAGGDENVKFDEVTLSGTTVAAGGLSGGAAFSLDKGDILWKPEADVNGCYDMGYGGGEGLVAARKCGSYDDPQVSVENLNATTGAPISTFKMPPGVEYAHIVSTKPLVVAADVGDTAGDGSGISDFFVIDEKTGKLIVKIPADADTYGARCDSTAVEDCREMAVGNGKLYLPTEEHDGTGEEQIAKTNEIVAFDLTTGKSTSERADAGNRHTIFPMRMDGANIIAYRTATYEGGGQVVSINGGTFKETVLMENPSDENTRAYETRFVVDGSEYDYADGRLFISNELISKPMNAQSAELDNKVLLALGFTTH